MKLCKMASKICLMVGDDNMIEDIDYKYLFPENDPHAIHIELLTGPYVGVVFRYDKVEIDAENEELDGEIYLQFSYDVVEYTDSNFINDINFKNYIGNLLIILMSNTGKEIYESGISNTKELNI